MLLPPLRNGDGDPVDPVPFAVVAGLTLMVTLSFGPIYGLAYGVPLWLALVTSVGVFLAASLGAYRWFVRDARPPRSEGAAIPGQVAFLVYLSIALVVLVVALTLPLALGRF